MKIIEKNSPTVHPDAAAAAVLPPRRKQVYVYSPSGAVRDKAAFKRGIRQLEKFGCDVEVDSAALASHQRFAGDDATRLQAIHRAAASGADVALMSRGGYGISRLLPGIDYPLLAEAIAKGCQFVGYSDFTALQMALLAKTGSITWAGPVVGGDFGALPEADDIMLACFEDVLLGRAEGSGWCIPKARVSKAKAKLAKDALDGTPELIAACAANTSQNPDFTVENALLWGGNLVMLVSLLGTPYMPSLEAVKAGILFLEDTGEPPYKIERLLTQLLYAGYLTEQQAIIFGNFDGYTLTRHDKGFAMATVLQWLSAQTAARVVAGLPFGHGPLKVILPVGCKKTTLVVEGRQALLLWGEIEQA